MAVGLGELPVFGAVKGVQIGVGQAGIKTPGRSDLVLFELVEGASVAAVFTRNAFCAAPVRIAKKHLAARAPKFLLINTGNANAGTGPQGIEDALRCCQSVADTAGCEPEEVLPFSTGVIGEPLPVDKIVQCVPQTYQTRSPENWSQAASGILTTDTLPKGASTTIEIDGHPVVLSGISKGAGMIRPNMATMLAFVATDAQIAPARLQQFLNAASERSFNRITVDSDTSTNDACILVATGQSDAAEITSDSDNEQVFVEALNALMLTLAQAIVRDAEGATKFVTITVEQAASAEEALEVAYTIAHSPLVKTALFASDPNWGRILAAVGRANVPQLDVDQVSIFLDEVCIVEQGGRAASYTEAAGQKVMDQSEIQIRIVLGRGEATETLWTSDLSHEYVRINAEYRT